MIEESSAPWLTVRRGLAPVLLCMPHTGTRIPPAIEAQLASAWLARKGYRLVDRAPVRVCRGPRRKRRAHRRLAHRHRSES